MGILSKEKTISKLIIGVFLPVLCLAVLCFLVLIRVKTGLSKNNVNNAGQNSMAPKEEFYSRFVGERIVYDIKVGMLKVGKATFNHLEKTKLNGEEASLMVFQTRLAQFDDTEKIYSGYRNFLPLRIERDINSWRSPEKITEDYDQQNFMLTITKFKGKNKEVLSIQKDGVIHNAILLPFHVRMLPKLEAGWTLLARLPTRQFVIKLISLEDVTVPAGRFRCYRFESEPKKLEIWISTDERRIPVKLKGTGVLGYTMVMRSYSLER